MQFPRLDFLENTSWDSPEFLQITLLGNTAADYLIAIGLILAAVLASLIINRLIRKYIYSWARTTETHLEHPAVERILSPLALFVIVGGIALARNNLSVPKTLSFWLDKAIMILLLVMFFVVLIRIVHALIEFMAAGYIRRSEEFAAENLEERKRKAVRIKKLAREVTTLALGVMALLTILSNLGLNLKAVWASLGIGGIAVALAVQEPLRNLVGRIYIYGTGIFSEGHYIVFDKWEGTVKRITAFRTYVEIFADMTTVSIPNSDFIKGPVKNYHGRTAFMFKWDLDVPYDVTPERVQELVLKLREMVLSKPEVSKDKCWIYLDRLGASSKGVRVWFRANLPAWAESLYYGDRVLHDIQLVFESMQIPFAFPTQTMHFRADTPVEVTRKESTGT